MDILEKNQLNYDKNSRKISIFFYFHGSPSLKYASIIIARDTLNSKKKNPMIILSVRTSRLLYFSAHYPMGNIFHSLRCKPRAGAFEETPMHCLS